MIDNIWIKYDKDRSGTLEKKECYQLFKDLAEISNDYSIYKNCDYYIDILDKDGDGTLSKKEVISILIKNK